MTAYNIARIPVAILVGAVIYWRFEAGTSPTLAAIAAVATAISVYYLTADDQELP